MARRYSAEEIRTALGGLPKVPDLRSEPGAPLAAVLIPVLASRADLRVVFTRRTETLSRHAGEISFPGGMTDPGEGLEAAALREAHEELGLRPSDVEVVGVLPPVLTHVSGVLVVPFAGLLRDDPAFTPNAHEIAEVLEFPLSDLIARGSEREFERQGHRFQTYVYEIEGHVIWGATGRILRSFIEVMRART